VVDHLEDTIKIIVCLKRGDSYKRCARHIEEIIERLISKSEDYSYKDNVLVGVGMTISVGRNGLRSNLTRDEFIRMVRRAKGYIADGDIYQINLSQRLEMDHNGDTLRLYKRLRDINPSPFGGLLRLRDISIVSSSPERLIKVNRDYIETRPIAGTRPRGRNKVEDLYLSTDLLLNEKERAEHLMLVDLERNDLGRICQYGTVEVDDLMSLEGYSHVWHIVSNIHGRLMDSIDLFDILRSCFPGGTITGCPKVRCMEIIDELEPTQRGPYTGSMGYIGYGGDIDMNIIIRTILIKDGRGYISVGAGIVADSDPEREYLETLDKAKAMIGAIQGSI
jgi:anthranilate synthase component 1/para-aminobenzoate synthetase component 1